MAKRLYEAVSWSFGFAVVAMPLVIAGALTVAYAISYRSHSAIPDRENLSGIEVLRPYYSCTKAASETQRPQNRDGRLTLEELCDSYR